MELGAGSAPITRPPAQEPQAAGMTLVPCDVAVNEGAFRELAERYPDRVKPLFTSVDMTQPPHVDGKTLFVISGSWHHVPFSRRTAALQSLMRSARCVAVFEGRQFTPRSMLLTLTGCSQHSCCRLPGGAAPDGCDGSCGAGPARRASPLSLGWNRQLPAAMDGKRMAASAG